MNKKAIDELISYRGKFGKIKSRDEIKKIKGISDKVFEQSVGFMRILDGTNPLDKTSIHPENYKDALKLLNFLDLSVNDIGTDKLRLKLNDINISDCNLDIDKYTFEDIKKSLMQPSRDPRDSLPRPILKSDILHASDLHVGDKLQGTVRNVVDFGLFIDVGLHNDCLAHISKLSDKYLRHPSEMFSVGDIVDCYVIEIDKDREKVSLSLIEEK